MADESGASAASRIAKSKLEAFSQGRMNVMQKKTPYQLRKEEQEKKRKVAEQEAAKAYAEFVAHYSDSTASAKAFVRSETVQGKDVRPSSDTGGRKKLWKPDSELEAKRSAPRSAPKPLKASKSGKKMSNMELFMEQIKRNQEERDQRHGQQDASGMPSLIPGIVLPPPPVMGGGGMLGMDPGSKSGSFDTGDPATTNLYVGNLSPQMNEGELCKHFGKYGPLASVKIMWPRTQEEKSRGRLCGFVAFMKRKDGQNCLDDLNGKEINGFEIKLGCTVHAVCAAGMKIKTGLPFNAQASVASMYESAGFGNDQFARQRNMEAQFATASVVVVIPNDRAVRQLIHRTVEFVIREGPEFEALLMQRVAGDAKFNFLFANDTFEHTYYRWKLFSILQGDRMDRWAAEPFRMFLNGPMWEPPDEDQLKFTAEDVEKGHLSSDNRDRLEDILRGLTPERKDIAKAMVFCITHADAAAEIVDCVAESLQILETPIHTKVARLFLVSDILHNCSASVKNASFYRSGFEAKLNDIFKALNATFKAISGYAPNVFEALENLFNFGTTDPTAAMRAPVGTNSASTFTAAGVKGSRVRDDGAMFGHSDEDDEDDDVDGVPFALAAPTTTKGVAVADIFGNDDDDEDLDGTPLNAPANAAPGASANSTADGNAKRRPLSKWEMLDDDDDDGDDTAATKRSRLG